ncbi:hypothetical protein TBR22_A34200 [Luteitalea sp. TBR-22]|uniref:hypothetical protein n=1 Tax=Luteitalea sp. TBR-22 TaxID=2802971 RepID=UPI001AFC5ED9|nr:hypothetical protein [Luteitalea sp. TBR-22]BCS34191.1 hypothetical protein TBR22_A34200 [Luteitalea sp. TBR-22]
MCPALLAQAAVLLLVAHGVDADAVTAAGRGAAPRGRSAVHQQAADSSTVLALDVPAGPMRPAAAMVAGDVLHRLEATGSMVAVTDIHDEFSVVEDLADCARARDGLQRWLRGDTWAYRHVDLGAASGGKASRSRRLETLRSVIVDAARLGVARVVLITAVGDDPGSTRAYAETAGLARAHDVQVHVVGLQDRRDGAADDSLLGAEVTPTRQGMAECDPRRVACGDVAQVGQDERLDRGAAVAAAWRGLARLTSDTGGVLVRTPTKSQALIEALASGRSRHSGATPARVPEPPAWRDRESQAWLNQDGSESYTSRRGLLEVIRVPSDGGMRLILLLSAAATGSAGPWSAFVRVRDASDRTLAAWSRTGTDPFARPLMFLAPSGAEGGSVDLVVQGERTSTRDQRPVPAREQDAGAGDLFIVERIESLTDSSAGHPLASDGRLYVPMAGAVVRRSDATHLTAAIATRDVATSLIVDLLRDGHRPRRTSVQSRAASGVTRITPIALPLQDLADGTYELSVSGQNGGREWTRSVAFTIIP